MFRLIKLYKFIHHSITFFGSLFREQIRQSFPTLIWSIYFKILTIINVVVLIIFIVVLLFEIRGDVFDLLALFVFPHCSLLGLEPVFFRGSLYHVSVFKAPLVRSTSGIGGSYLVL